MSRSRVNYFSSKEIAVQDLFTYLVDQGYVVFFLIDLLNSVIQGIDNAIEDQESFCNYLLDLAYASGYQFKLIKSLLSSELRKPNQLSSVFMNFKDYSQ